MKNWLKVIYHDLWYRVEMTRWHLATLRGDKLEASFHYNEATKHLNALDLIAFQEFDRDPD